VLSQHLSTQGVILVDSIPEQISTDPAFIFSTLPVLQTAQYLKEWSEQGWQGRLISTYSLHNESFASVSGEWRDRACFVTSYPLPKDVTGLDRWKHAYVNTGPHVPEPGPFALPTYELVYMLAEVIEELYITGKPLTRVEVSAALARTSRTGKLGVITWDQSGYWHDAPMHWYCWKNTPLLTEPVP
jgi:ABC-type branched-subunit amino acid transport system substrate-binding protein